MTIQAIYFDIGGVLVRTEQRAPRAALAQRLGMTYETLDELVFGGAQGRRAQCGEVRAEDHWAFICQQLGWPLEDWLALQKEFFAGDRLDENLVNLARRLHRRYRTGIISNAFSDVRATLHQRWQMADAFDVLIFSAEVGVMKPDPVIYRAALQALRVQPEQALFIDDFAHNVEGARAVGMQAIHFRSPEQAQEELKQFLAPEDLV